ncbi:hypothetical protein [Nocardia nova]|uniref:hypothetical protein n=1 Tax=Nocardia nova TaxID=37330 RepID=UPI0025AF5F4D|nr:hypothetical protein [Nocardia nova]
MACTLGLLGQSWRRWTQIHAYISTGWLTMRLQFLGKGGSHNNGCPTLYASDRDTYVVQGWRTDQDGTIEIPHLLLGFAEPDTFVGATLTDTGRGTFTLTGDPVADSEALAQMDIPEREASIEVPKLERTFYGATGDR